MGSFARGFRPENYSNSEYSDDFRALRDFLERYHSAECPPTESLYQETVSTLLQNIHTPDHVIRPIIRSLLHKEKIINFQEKVEDLYHIAQNVETKIQAVAGYYPLFNDERRQFFSQRVEEWKEYLQQLRLQALTFTDLAFFLREQPPADDLGKLDEERVAGIKLAEQTYSHLRQLQDTLSTENWSDLYQNFREWKISQRDLFEQMLSVLTLGLQYGQRAVEKEKWTQIAYLDGDGKWQLAPSSTEFAREWGENGENFYGNIENIDDAIARASRINLVPPRVAVPEVKPASAPPPPAEKPRDAMVSVGSSGGDLSDFLPSPFSNLRLGLNREELGETRPVIDIHYRSLRRISNKVNSEKFAILNNDLEERFSKEEIFSFFNFFVPEDLARKILQLYTTNGGLYYIFNKPQGGNLDSICFYFWNDEKVIPFEIIREMALPYFEQKLGESHPSPNRDSQVFWRKNEDTITFGQFGFGITYCLENSLPPNEKPSEESASVLENDLSRYLPPPYAKLGLRLRMKLKEFEIKHYSLNWLLHNKKPLNREDSHSILDFFGVADLNPKLEVTLNYNLSTHDTSNIFLWDVEGLTFTISGASCEYATLNRRIMPMVESRLGPPTERKEQEITWKTPRYKITLSGQDVIYGGCMFRYNIRAY